jgi:hypothetical protein
MQYAVVGAFETEADALEAREILRAGGLSAVLTTTDDMFELRVHEESGLLRHAVAGSANRTSRARAAAPAQLPGVFRATKPASFPCTLSTPPFS